MFDVEASDNDQPGMPNSDLTFQLSDTSQPFEIDENSGEITISGSLEATTYNIVVLVRDKGTPSLNSTGIFILEVAPTNNYAPEFNEPFEFYITENTSPDEAVFTFNVTDMDVGEEGIANLTLRESDYSRNFTLEFSKVAESTVEGKLYLLDKFDRETITNFTITVEASDSGYVKFRKSSSQSFAVNVLDANDNPPMFSDTPYAVTVAEDRTGGYVFFSVNATDDDSGANAELEFRLVDGFNETFSINPSTGEVSVTGTLHKATQDRYEFEIFVNDEGDPSLNATTTLNITVDEVNDNLPYFTEPREAVTMMLAEDVETGYVLLNVSVEDDDTGLAGQVRLSLSPSNSSFRIDNSSLVLDSALNYEVSTLFRRNFGVPNLVVPPSKVEALY